MFLSSFASLHSEIFQASYSTSLLSNHFKNKSVARTNQIIERQIPGAITPVFKRGFPASAASPFGKICSNGPVRSRSLCRMADRHSADRFRAVYDRRHPDRSDPDGGDAQLRLRLDGRLLRRLLRIARHSGQQRPLVRIHGISGDARGAAILYDEPAADHLTRSRQSLSAFPTEFISRSCRNNRSATRGPRRTNFYGRPAPSSRIRQSGPQPLRSGKNARATLRRSFRTSSI